MNTSLKNIQSWLEVAEEANWSASGMARHCGVSVRTLERHFSKHIGKSPRIWLFEQRQLKALKKLGEGLSVKQVASHLRYNHQTHFSRGFKRYWGSAPSTHPQKKWAQ